MSKKDLDYLELVNKLEEIVSKLESGKQSLEQSMELFTEGMDCIAKCDKKLKEYEGKIVKLTENGEVPLEE